MIREGVVARGKPAAVAVVVAWLELTWLYALLYTTVDMLGIAIPVSSLLLVYVVSFAWTILLRRLCRSSRTIVVVSWSVWPLVTVLLLAVVLYPDAAGVEGLWSTIAEAFRGIGLRVGAAVFMVIASGVLWLLAARVANIRLNHRAVLARVLVGLIVLACSLLAGYVAGTDETVTALVAVVFVGLALGAAALTRVDDGEGGGSSRQGAAWWGMFVAGVVVVLGVGLAVAALMTPDLMTFVWRGLRSLGGIVADLFRTLWGILPSSCSDSPDVAEGTMPTDIHDIPMGGGPGSSEQGSSSTAGVVYIGVILGVLVLVLVGLFAIQLVQWMRKSDRDRAEMEYLPGGFRLDMKRLFRRLAAWLGGLKLFGARRRQWDQESEESASMRRLYTDMLRWGAKAGMPRSSSATPYEYQETLSAAWPAHGADVALVTESYVRTKYAAQPPNGRELERLRATLRALKRKKPRPPKRGPTGRITDETEDHGSEER